MRARREVVTVLVALVLMAIPGSASMAGCSSPRIDLRSKVVAENGVAIQRLVVLAKLKDVLGDEMSESFSIAMSNMLTRCGVQSRVLNVGSRDLAQPRVDQASRDLSAETFLEIEPIGGSSYTYSDRVEGDYFLQLQLSDLGARKQLWLAKAQLAIKARRDAAAGEDFANSIVTRLRDDRVLKDCSGD